jgi:hypothetical protein
MLTRRHIEKLNAPQKARNPVPLLAAGTALIALLLFAVGFLLLDSPLVGAGLAAAALVAGGAATFARHREYARARLMEVQYGMMDGATAARFSRMQKAFEVLVASDRIWRADQQVGKTSEAPPIEIRVADPPHLSTDVDVWSIDTGGSSAYFLPEAVLVYQDGKYRAISYQALRVEMSSEKTVEEGEMPGDAEVVGKTWRHLAEDGTSPDPTRSFNPQVPQVVYGALRLNADNWEGVDLRVSSESAAAQFVLAFLDVNPNPERVERWYGVRPYEERGKGDPAYAVLGLEEGASKHEVTAAYRRIARTYHPDRTANFVPEFRAIADRRMKEINAAYSRLRREAT